MRRAAAIAAIAWASLSAESAPPLLHTTFYPVEEPAGIVEAALDRRGVDPNAVRLLEDGNEGNRPDSTREFRLTGHGVSAVLAIDASGSVGSAQFEWVKAALRDFVSSGRPQDRISVVAFADNVEVRQAFTADKAQLTRSIEALRAGGRFTLLNQAIGASLQLLAAEKTNIRRRLLLITDGRNEGAGPDMATLENQARGAAIPVDCIGVTRLPVRYLLPMQSLTTASGGAYVRVKSYEKLRSAMSEGIEGLLGSPVMTFRLAHIRPDGASHTLQVKIAGATSEPVKVVFPNAPAEPAILYLFATLALLLFAAGMVSIAYGRRKRNSAAVEHAPEIPRAVPDAAVSAAMPGPLRPHTQTVYSPDPQAKNRPGAPGAKGASAPMPATSFAESTSPPAQSRGRFPPPQPAPRPLVNGTQFRQIFPAPAVGRPTAWLRALPDGARFGIEDANTWIGAGAENRIRVADDAAVSWNHACVQWAAGDLYVFDNLSTNGTRVNGARMEPGSRVRLQPGDEILIGHASFSLEV